MGVGETAQFDDVSRELTCSECLGGERRTAGPVAAGAPRPTSPEPPESGASTALRAPVAAPRRAEVDPAQVRALIADARAALAASRHAS